MLFSCLNYFLNESQKDLLIRHGMTTDALGL